jgi:hypothetical protein
MHKSILPIAAISLALSVTMAPMAFARSPGGAHGGGRPAFAAASASSAPAWQGSSPPGFSRGLKTGWNGESVPPGWSKGKKKGWKNLKLPPGLYGR